MNRESLMAQLAISEGKRLKAYLDTVGVLTVGIGHNCVARPVSGVSKVGDTISEEISEELFDSDLNDVVVQLDRNLPWWSALDDVRQNVVADMCFNMGITTLLKFRGTLAAIEEGRYQDAAAGMLASKWARQVGNRAKKLARQMETGAE